MNELDVRVMRSLLRWAAAGVMPKRDLVDWAVDAAARMDAGEDADKIRAALSVLRLGTLPNHDCCAAAAQALDSVESDEKYKRFF